MRSRIPISDLFGQKINQKLNFWCKIDINNIGGTFGLGSKERPILGSFLQRLRSCFNATF